MTTDRWPTVPRLLADNSYCVLATSDAHGVPWATPVYFAARGHDELFWVSSGESRHSQNIATRPSIAITVFDSTVAVGAAEAIYLSVDAGPCTDTAAALDAMNSKLPARSALDASDLTPAGPLTMYRARVDRWYVLVRGGDPSFDNVIDRRLEVRPPGDPATEDGDRDRSQSGS